MREQWDQTGAVALQAAQAGHHLLQGGLVGQGLRQLLHAVQQAAHFYKQEVFWPC